MISSKIATCDLCHYEVTQSQQTIHSLRAELQMNYQTISSLQQEKDDLVLEIKSNTQSHEEAFKSFQEALQHECTAKLQEIIVTYETDKDKWHEEIQLHCEKEERATQKIQEQETAMQELITKCEELEKKLAATECLDCKDLKAQLGKQNGEIKKLTDLQQELQYMVRGADDELLYYRDENARLEKQVALVQQDLVALQTSTVPSTPGIETRDGDGEHYFVLLKSEREQSK